MQSLWKMAALNLRLKTTWQLSRNSSDQKQNYLIYYKKAVSEVAPNIRYGETPELIEQQFLKFQKKAKMEIQSYGELEEILNTLDLCASLRFGIESAWVHFKSQNQVAQYFEIPNPVKKISTSFSIPIMEPTQVKNYLEKNAGYEFYKVKVNQQQGIALVRAVSDCTDRPLRIDGNEAWTDLASYLQFEQWLGEQSIQVQMMEQPFAAKDFELYEKLKPDSRFDLFADESVTRETRIADLASGFHGVNIKLMKAGSYQRAIEQLKEARVLGLKTMLGCMIESDIGIGCAKNLTGLAEYYDLDGNLLIFN